MKIIMKHIQKEKTQTEGTLKEHSRLEMANGRCTVSKIS
jgi:hypothetical protein